MQQPMRSDTWLQDRKRQGLWVKWVLARVCRKKNQRKNTHTPMHIAGTQRHKKQECAASTDTHTHTQTFHIFCGHLGLIKGK